MMVQDSFHLMKYIDNFDLKNKIESLNKITDYKSNIQALVKVN